MNYWTCKEVIFVLSVARIRAGKKLWSPKTNKDMLNSAGKLTRPEGAETITPQMSSGMLLTPPHISSAALELLCFYLKIQCHWHVSKHKTHSSMLIVLFLIHLLILSFVSQCCKKSLSSFTVGKIQWMGDNSPVLVTWPVSGGKANQKERKTPILAYGLESLC